MPPKKRRGPIRPTRREVKDALQFLAPDDPKIQKKLDDMLEKKRYAKTNTKQSKPKGI